MGRNSVIPNFSRFSFSALHCGICCGVKLWAPHRIPTFPVLARAHIELGSDLTSNFLPSYKVYLLRPFSNATVYWRISSGVSLGFEHKNRSCIILLCIFRIKMSKTKLLICPPNSHFEARLLSEFQNGCGGLFIFLITGNEAKSIQSSVLCYNNCLSTLVQKNRKSNRGNLACWSFIHQCFCTA